MLRQPDAAHCLFRVQMEGFVLSQELQPQSSIVSCSNKRVTLTIFLRFQQISFCASSFVSMYPFTLMLEADGEEGKGIESIPLPLFPLLAWDNK